MDIEQKSVTPKYVGTGGDIFKLSFVTGFLTFITFGIYRFWAKTRVRRFVWSSIKIGDDAVEYTGNGLEKFLGFLIAVVVLAIYLGILQVLLTFLGYNMFATLTNQAITNVEVLAQIAVVYGVLIALIPLILFAQYRGRRYMLSRTRWRGVRMGMTQGAWGYTFRALGYGLLMGLTLGILLPLNTYNLNKYMVDRTWFGDAKMEQGGKWTALYPGLLHVAIAIGILIVGSIMMAAVPALGFVLLFVGYIWIIVGYVYYKVYAYRYLTSHQTLDDAVTFSADTRTGEVIKTYILGGLLVGLISIAAFLPVGLIVAGAAAALGSGGTGGAFGVVILTIVAYLAALTVIMAAYVALVTQPILAHFVHTTTIHNTDHLDTIRQRADDSIPDADGFADALDVGGAF
ncbi:MAG: DUF898 family protein [Pseudomonadota bacterium]